MSHGPSFTTPTLAVVPAYPSAPFPLGRVSVITRRTGVELEEVFARAGAPAVNAARYEVWGALLAAGWTTLDIARAFGRHHDAVRLKLFEHGIVE